MLVFIIFVGFMLVIWIGNFSFLERIVVLEIIVRCLLRNRGLDGCCWELDCEWGRMEEFIIVGIKVGDFLFFIGGVSDVFYVIWFCKVKF